MNFDDPRLTAYALGEMESDHDRAEVEALLKEHPELAAELEETRAMAGFLRRELKAEEAAPLTSAQRDAVLSSVTTDRPVNGHSANAAAEPADKVIAMPLWRRRWVPSAIAATVVLTTGIGALWKMQQPRYVPLAAQPETSTASIPINEPTSDTRSEFYASAGAPDGVAKQLAAPPSTERELRQEVANAAPAPQPAVRLDAAKNELPALTISEAPVALSKAKDEAGLPGAAARGGQPSLDTLGEKKRSTLMGGTLADNSALGVPPVPAKPSAMRSMPVPAAAAPDALASPELSISRAESRGRDSNELGKTTAEGKIVSRGRIINAPDGINPQTPQPNRSAAKSIAYSDSDRFARPSEKLGREQADAAEPATRGYAESLASGLSVNTASEGTYWAAQPGMIRPSQDPNLRLQFEPSNTESYDNVTDNAFLSAKENPLSTFSIDVDTASYANVRRFLTSNQRPPKGAVRIEELINYFPYTYPQPQNDDPFSCTMEVAACPWKSEHRLVRVGLKGREIAREKLPPTNLVFLLDVSGSMQPANKLPLVKECMQQLVDTLREQDTVGIVVYAGSSGTVLEPTSDKTAIRSALARLEAGGSTNGASGIQGAYDLAQRAFKKGGNNRVILATDGDFNVGVTNQSDLVDLIQRRAKGGVFLSVLGFGMGNTKDSTMEKLADKGNGNYAYIDSLKEGRKVLVEEMAGTLFTIAKDVKIQVEFNPTKVGAYRLIGYENRLLAKEDFNDDTKDAGEIGAGHTVTALYEVVPAGEPLPVSSTVDPLKYQTVAPTITWESAAAPTEQGPARPPGSGNAPKQGDPFSGDIYLLDEQGKTRRLPAPAVTPAPAVAAPTKASSSSELLTLKLRFKQPDGDTSVLREFPLTDTGTAWEQSSQDFHWAAAVASFGMLLRDSPHRGNSSWDSVLTLANQGKGEDRGGYRSEFLNLVERARQLVPVNPIPTVDVGKAQVISGAGKAASIVLPDFDVKDLPVLDVIDALAKKSRERDPEGKGVSVVFAGSSGSAQARLTLAMRNISVLDAAKTVASASGLTLQEEGNTLILRAGQP